MRTLPRPAPAPLPDRISLVTVLVSRNVTRIATNIHIIGCRVRSARPTGTFTPDGTRTRVGSFTREASKDAVPAAPTRTASSCAQCLMPGFYAQRSPPAWACGPGLATAVSRAGLTRPGPATKAPVTGHFAPYGNRGHLITI